jgi:trigger factor
MSIRPRPAVITSLLALAAGAVALVACSAQTSTDSTTSATPPGQSSPSTSASASAATATGTFSYSDGIDDNGYWDGITAGDYVELYDYEAFPIPKATHEITDEAVQAEIDSMLASFATTTNVTDRAVVDGDTVNIDYVGSVGGVEFDGGSTDGAGTDVTIGVTSYIDDFLEQIIGHTPGDTFDINVTFPEDYGVDELNGQDAVFVTTVNYIVQTDTPELTDAFVVENLAATYGWVKATEVRDGIKADLQKAAIQNYIYDYLTTEVPVSSLPESLIAYEQEAMLFYYQEGADYYGMDLDEFLASYVGVSSVDELIEMSAEDNQLWIRYTLVVQAIAEAEGIVATEEDVATYFSEQMGLDDYSSYEAQYGLPYLKQSAMVQKVMDYLYDHVVLE